MSARKTFRMKHLTLPLVALTALAASSLPAAADGSAVIEAQSVCNVSFHLMDENVDGMIDHGEASKQQNAVFKYLDQNGDGIISADEYGDCITGPNYMPTAYYKGRTPESFAMIDTNKDGIVSRAEYLNASRARYESAYNANSGQLRTAMYVDAMTGLTSQFAAADADGNGFISANEAVADVDYTFYRLDVNADGQITPNEWNIQPSPAHARVTSSFEAMDTNHDGRVDRSEYNAYWVSANSSLNARPMTVWDYRINHYYGR